MYLLEHYKYTLHIFTSPYGILKNFFKWIILSHAFQVLKSFHLNLFIVPHVMFNKYHVLFLSLALYYLIKWIKMFYDIDCLKPTVNNCCIMAFVLKKKYDCNWPQYTRLKYCSNNFLLCSNRSFLYTYIHFDNDGWVAHSVSVRPTFVGLQSNKSRLM